MTLLSQLICVRDEQDRVLRHQPDEQDHSDLAVDIERRAGNPQRRQRAGDGEWNGQQHSERVKERLVLRGQYHEHEDERKRKCEEERASTLVELARLARQIHRASRRKDLDRRSVQRIKRLTKGESRSHARRQRKRSHAVEMVELAWTDVLLDARHRIERHEIVVPSTHLYAADVGGR